MVKGSKPHLLVKMAAICAGGKLDSLQPQIAALIQQKFNQPAANALPAQFLFHKERMEKTNPAGWVLGHGRGAHDREAAAGNRISRNLGKPGHTAIVPELLAQFFRLRLLQTLEIRFLATSSWAAAVSLQAQSGLAAHLGKHGPMMAGK